MIDIEALLDKIPIVDYISQYIELEKNSNNEYVGISPFSMKDINPSFTITPENGLFYDFSFGVGGNVLNFIQQYNKVSFPQALKIACDYIGTDVENMPQQLDIIQTIKKFKKQEQKSKQIKRKILDKNIMQKYEFKLEKLKIWIDEDISLEVLKKYEVMYDAFSNKIVFPIWDVTGEIISIKGRSLDEHFTAKYIYFYELGNLDTIFNFWQRKDSFKEKNEIILFEAEKSVLKAESYGITNTAAIMTSHLNLHQMRILCELGVDVVFALDEGININTDKNIQLLKRFTRVDYIWNFNKLMEEKAAPIDQGKNIFLELYDKKRRLE